MSDYALFNIVLAFCKTRWMVGLCLDQLDVNFGDASWLCIYQYRLWHKLNDRTVEYFYQYGVGFLWHYLNWRTMLRSVWCWEFGDTSWMVGLCFYKHSVGLLWHQLNGRNMPWSVWCWTSVSPVEFLRRFFTCNFLFIMAWKWASVN